MAAVSQRTMMIAGVPVLVIAAFALGYLAGSRNQNPPAPAPAMSMGSMPPLSMQGQLGQSAEGQFGNHPMMSASGEPKVAGLGSLVAGLEKKVAANPENLDQAVLLARTYKELGEHAKGVTLLRTLHQKHPDSVDVSAALAELLASGSDKQELQEGYRLLDEVARQKADYASTARLRQREIRMKLGDTAKVN